jgi:hypothetical protein
VVNSDFGPFSLDLEQVELAKEMVALGKKKPDERDPFSVIIEEFLGGHYLHYTRYWNPNLGRLMKLFSQEYFLGEDWHVVEEFKLNKERKVNPLFKVVKIPGEEDQQFLHTGIRLMKHVGGQRMVVAYSTDDDGDERLSVYHVRQSGDRPLMSFGNSSAMFGYKIIEDLEEAFFQRGPLKGRFFDLDYNFIKKDTDVGNLIAWDGDVKAELKRNVIDFHKAMPKLQALGMNSSRGIILAGPPGTGKTMIGKWLAGSTGMTSILVSAEMIRSRGSIKSVYQRARKLSPSLIIVEDIDTTGGMDRRVADHPLLGEFLQCMDGMVKNSGVITLATTNHSQSIDPAIADRPGRFDRVIEVGLPGLEQRQRILERKIEGIEKHKSITKKVLKSIANRSKGLSGAWVIEVVQFAQVLALSRDEDVMTADDLEASLDDVLARRGLAYRIDSMPSDNPWKDDESGLGSLWG